MKKFWLLTLGAVGIAAIWGYFLDLRQGNVAGFIAKIFLVFAFMVGFQFSMRRNQKKINDNVSNETNNINKTNNVNKSNKSSKGKKKNKK
ncbi:hypothetical protein KQI86_03340 [Clostridium sp. MSJ-11]|uniref:Uncharacterized protein n=1 Tax=Clostridium mobile TaxID=2841512 RepID=A0ABS6EDR6_9CLOT|nr:hypothetical protein [Clostridium mobile]MBU5483347.1 hypothetical protein [Clostridium mobile]